MNAFHLTVVFFAIVVMIASCVRGIYLLIRDTRDK